MKGYVFICLYVNIFKNKTVDIPYSPVFGRYGIKYNICLIKK